MGSDGPAGGGAKGGGGVSRPGQRFLFFFDSVFSRSCIMTESVAWFHGLFAKLTSPHRHFHATGGFSWITRGRVFSTWSGVH